MAEGTFKPPTSGGNTKPTEHTAGGFPSASKGPRGDSEFERHKELVENSKKPQDDHDKNPNTFDNNGALWSHLSEARSYITKGNLSLAVSNYTMFVNTFLEKAKKNDPSESKIVEKVVNLYKNNGEAKECVTTPIGDWMPNFEFRLLERTETEPFVLVTKKPKDFGYLTDFLKYTPNVFIEAARAAEALLATNSLKPEKQDEVEKSKNLWWVLGIRCFETQIPKRIEDDLQGILPTYVNLAREAIYKTHDIALLDMTTDLIFSQRIIEYETYNPLAQFELYLHSAAFYSRAGMPKSASYLIKKAKDVMLKTVKIRENEIKSQSFSLTSYRFSLTLERLMRWYWLADQLGVVLQHPVLQHPGKPEDYFRNLYKPMEESKRSELESYKEAMQPLVDACKLFRNALLAETLFTIMEEVVALNDKFAALGNKFAALKDEFDTLSYERATLNNKFAALGNKFAALKDEFDTLSYERATLNDEAKALNNLDEIDPKRGPSGVSGDPKKQND